MKKTLLSLFLITSMTVLSQDFSTGTVTFSADLSAKIDISGSTNITTLTLSGPSGVWFAVGFGGSNMSAGADIFRTDGTTIDDARSTGQFMPPNDAQQDWTLVSNTISIGVRTIVATRANNTGDSNDFVFSPSGGSISMIWAVGATTNTAQQHASRGATAAAVTLGIKENKLLSFNMFPNPASDQVNIQLPTGTESAKVFVYDYVGRLMSSQTVTSNNPKIDVTGLSSGMYIIRVTTDDKIGAQQFIKS
ncbi:MAG: T9SS type A sorting domain-containing protein [Flavobacteriaceae bacterium]|nr:T9SS type A sorting domain-containing protein [Flavobacteriaceae bacterium]